MRRRVALLGVALALASWRLEFRTSLEPPAKVLVEWRFEREGDWKGWQPNAHVAEVKVAEGALSFRTIGDDPILEFRPLLDLPASPWQAIEIRLKSDSDGLAEFFWSNTTEPPYGGFRPHKRTPFWVIGDNQWRTYRLFPFWHLEGKILRLRFDPPSGARVAIAFVRIVEFSVGQGVGETGKVRDWTVVGEAKLMPQQEGWSVELQSPDAFLLTPVSVDAEANSFLSVRLSATSGKLATLFFACDQTKFQSHYGAIATIMPRGFVDASPHVSIPLWCDYYRLRLDPCTQPNVLVEVDYLRLTK